MSETLFLAVLFASAPGRRSPGGRLGRAGPDGPPGGRARARPRAGDRGGARRDGRERRRLARGVECEAPQFSLNSTPGYSTGLPLSVAGRGPVGRRREARHGSLRLAGSDRRSSRRRPARRDSEGALGMTRSDVARRDRGRLREALGGRSPRRERAPARSRRREALARRQRALAARRALDRARRRAGGPRGGARPAEALRGRVGSRPRPPRARAPRRRGARSTRSAWRRTPPRRCPSRLPWTRSRSPRPAIRDCARSPPRARRSSSRRSCSRAGFQPSVHAEARYAFVPRGFGYDKYYLTFQENVASVGVSVVLPVLTGGRESAAGRAVARALERVLTERRLREEELDGEIRAGRGAARPHAPRARDRPACRRAGRAGSGSGEGARAGRAGGGGRPRSGVDRAFGRRGGAWRALRDQLEAKLALLDLRGELLAALGAEEAPPSPGS